MRSLSRSFPMVRSPAALSTKMISLSSKRMLSPFGWYFFGGRLNCLSRRC